MAKANAQGHEAQWRVESVGSQSVGVGGSVDALRFDNCYINRATSFLNHPPTSLPTTTPSASPALPNRSVPSPNSRPFYTMNATAPAPAALNVAPKRPLNKFFVYRREKAREVRDNHGHDNAGNVPSDGFSKWVSNLWAAEPPEVKDYYKRLADQEKEIHQRDHPGYQYKPQRKTKSSLSRKQRKEEERRRIDTIRRALSRASMSSASSDDSGLLTPLDAIDFSVPQDLSYLLKDNAETSQVDREPVLSSAPVPPVPSVPSVQVCGLTCGSHTATHHTVQTTTPISVPHLPPQNSQWSNTLAQWPQGAQPGLQPLPPQFLHPQALSRFLSSGFLGNQQAYLPQIPSHSLFPAVRLTLSYICWSLLTTRCPTR